MTLIEAIDARTSRRAYQESPIDAEKKNRLRELIDEYNKADGLSLRFIEDGGAAFGKLSKSYGMFKGVRSLFIIAGKTATPNLMEKLGYRGELLALEATRLGLGTCWVGGTFDRNDPALAVGDDETLGAVITVGNVASEMRGREKLIWGLAHHGEKNASNFYTADTEPPQWFKDGISAVIKAPSAINRQPVRFHLKSGVVTSSLVNPVGSGLIDLGIAKAHFEIASGVMPD
jgi:hypothetical protein